MVLKATIYIWALGHLFFVIIDAILDGWMVMPSIIVALVLSIFAFPFYVAATAISKKLAFHPAISIITMLIQAVIIAYAACCCFPADDNNSGIRFWEVSPQCIHQLIAATVGTAMATLCNYRILASFYHSSKQTVSNNTQREASNNFQREASNGAAIQQPSNNIQL